MGSAAQIRWNAWGPGVFERARAEGKLVFLDISATHEDRRTTLEMVSRVADSVFIPFTVGGGIRSVDDAGQALRAGADKVAINTAAVRDPSPAAHRSLAVRKLSNTWSSRGSIASSPAGDPSTADANTAQTRAAIVMG